MSQPHSCPEPKTLRGLVLGLVPDDQAEHLEQHLAECAHCVQTARALEQEDTLTDALRGGGKATAPGDDTQINDLMQRLEGLLKPANQRDVGQTADLTPATGSQSARDATRAIGDFLSPAQGPGEIGRLGRFRVLDELGAGGMGVVFRAEDSVLNRAVALKIMRPEVAARAGYSDRFLREARLMAAVEHPHLVPIREIGAEKGVPFLVMPLLPGESLDARLKSEARLPIPEALGIARQTAEALAALHARGLVHRDVKPSNIWLETGCVKLLDFGLAREAGEDARLTHSGVVVGTPAYMSPEQARGEKVDGRCDLFSLGCVLYQMLTGQRPFKGADVMAAIASLTLDRPAPPHALTPDVSRTLSDLTMRLLAKEPEGRPASAEEVVRALTNIEKQPAARTTVPGRRRLALVAAALLALVGGGLLLQQIIIRIRDDKGNVIAEVKAPPGSTIEVEKDGKKIKVPVNPGPGQPPQTEIKPDLLPPLKGGDPLSPLALVARPAKLPGVRSWSIETLGHRDRINAVAYSPNGKLIASAGQDGAIRLWDAAKGQLVRVLLGHSAAVSHLAWSPDSAYLASGGDDVTVGIWHVETGRLSRMIGVPERVHGLAWSPQGKVLAYTTGGQKSLMSLHFCDVSGGKPKTFFTKDHHAPGQLSWSSSGKLLVFADHFAGGGGVVVWDVEAGKSIQVLKDKDRGLQLPAWSPAGDMLAVVAHTPEKKMKPEVRLWSVATRKFTRTLAFNEPPYGGIQQLSWLPDGKTLALGLHGNGYMIMALARLDQDGPWTYLHLKETYYDNVAWSPDAKTMAIPSNPTESGTGLLVYDAGSGRTLQSLAVGHHPQHGTMAHSPSGTKAVFNGNTTQVRDSRTGEKLLSLPGVHFTWWSPDGKRLACLKGHIEVKVVDAQSGKVLHVIPPAQGKSLGRGVWAPGAWSPDGKMLALAYTEEPHELQWELRLWDVNTARVVHTIPGFNGQYDFPVLSWSPDGSLIAAAARAEKVRVFSTKTGKLVSTLNNVAFGGAGASRAIWSPDSNQLALTNEGKIDILDVRSGEIVDSLRTAPSEGAWPVAWSAKGNRLFGYDNSRSLHEWDAKTGRLVRTRPLPAGWHRYLFFAGFSMDARWMTYPVGPIGTNAWRTFDTENQRPQGTLLFLSDDRSSVISADGHHNNPRVDRALVYVVQFDDGRQETMTPNEFSNRFNWKNETDRARIISDVAN